MGEGIARASAGQVFPWLVRRRSERFARLLKKSGRVGNATALAAASVRNALLSALVAFPAAALLGVLISPLFALVALAPLAVAEAPELRMRGQVAQRREGAERELLFFAILASVLGSAGVPLYAVLKDLAGSDAFEWIGREAKLARRDVEVLGMNANEALERLAGSHPSKRFGDFLLGYTSKARSGGDVSFYLVGEGGSLLRGLQEGWTRYGARVGIIGSMMITAFGVVPLLLMVIGIFSPGVSVFGLAVFTGLGVPALTVALIHMAGMMQPVRGEAIRGRAGMAALLALPGVLVGVLTGLAWAGAAAALFAFFVLYGISVRRRLSETKGVDEGVARFLQDLLEYKRQEYDLTRAVLAIESSTRYNQHFDRLLAKVAAHLRAGVPLDEIRVDWRNRLGRMTFLLLGEMSRSGGGTVDTVYQMSSFAGNLAEMRKNARAEMKPYVALSYVSPLLLAFGVTFVEGVLSSFGARGTPGISPLHMNGIQLGSVPPGLSQMSDLLIVVSAASLGMIGAKISDLTVRNTLMASLNVALAVGAIALMTAFASHSPSYFV